jgi:3-oxoacyl-[acyl-carrier protein] reductase
MYRGPLEMKRGRVSDNLPAGAPGLNKAASYDTNRRYTQDAFDRPRASRMSHDLTGRAALVTGASGGIGRATAVALARAGAVVGIHYHASEAEAQATLQAVEAVRGTGLLMQADLREPGQADAAVDRFVSQAGRLDILFNNAGSPVERPRIEDCSTELWLEIFAVNVHAAFYVTRRAIPALRASGHGSIINNLTLSVQTGGANGAGPYAAAKGALQVLTRTLARELAPAVRVNAIMPGVIETRHHEQFSTAERMEQYRRETPLGRNGTPEEVAEVVLFLAGEASRFMTGALVDINGGRFLR